jgi:hypothetical protein
MRIVVKTLTVHLFCIFLFTFLYYYFSTHFDNKQYMYKSKLHTIIDFFLFSTTIQSGVGISGILPISIYSKLLMILQQLIMISVNVTTLYVLTV